MIDESGISKGVRRIVAVTGEEAEKIVNQGEILAQKIADLKTCLDIESRLKTLGNELDKSVISLIKKSELKLEYNKIKAEFIEADKARKAKEMKVVVEQIDEYFLKQPESPIVVLKLDAKTQKSLVHAANHMKKLEKSGLLFTVDGDKITMACNVSKLGLEKGIKATEWIDSMCAVVGGKAGGRDDYAQGSGNEIDRIDEATNVAIQFAKLKF